LRDRLGERLRGTTPDSVATSGSVGYSSTGIDNRVKLADPPLTEMWFSSVENTTGASGSRLAMSARRRPDTRTTPSSSMSATISVRDETS